MIIFLARKTNHRNQEFNCESCLSKVYEVRGIFITLVVAILGGAAKIFGFIGNP